MDLKNCLKILRELVEYYECSFSPGEATDQLLASRVKSFLQVCKEKQSDECFKSTEIYHLDPDNLDSNSAWNFTLCCLHILTRLIEALTIEESSLNVADKSDCGEASLLSVYQNLLVSKCFQFIVCLGIYPRLDRGVGIPLELRLSQAANFYYPDLSKSSTRDDDLFLIVNCFKTLLSNCEVADILIKHYLCDLLAALLQLAFAPTNSSNRIATSPTNQRRDVSNQSTSRCISPVCRESRTILHDLMMSLPASAIMKELLSLQGRNVSREKVVETSGKVVKIWPTPSWLRAGTGRLLTEQLLRSGGVLQLVSVFLNCSGASNAGIDACRELARVLSTVPRNITAADYWEKIAPQIRILLNISSSETDAWCYIRVAIDCMHKLADSSMKLMQQYFIDFYLDKFNSTLLPIPPQNELNDGTILLSAEDLDRSIQFLRQLTNKIDYSPKILSFLRSYSLPLFDLYCELMEKPFKLRRDIYGIVLWILKNSSSSESVGIFKAMLDLGKSDHSLKRFSRNVNIQQSVEGLQLVCERNSSDLDDDYKVLENVTVKVDVVMTIITEFKESSLVGDLFVCILEEYTQLVYQTKEQVPFKDTSSLLRGLDVISDYNKEDKEKYIRGFSILHLLDKMCDKVNENCIRRSDHVLMFAELTLSRCHSILKSTTEMDTFNFESESLSLAMALLSYIFTKKKILTKEKESMTRLMPLLHELSNLHPSEEIRDMANDLKICAATRGAILGGFDSKSCDSSGNAEQKGKSKLIEELPSEDDLEESSSVGAHSPTDNYSLSDALEDMCDPEVAVRGHGFIALATMVKNKDDSVVGKEDMLFRILKENIGHSDSYVYLAAIQGCASLALWNTDKVLPLLTDMFITGRNQSAVDQSAEATNNESSSSTMGISAAEQIRVSEDVDYRLKIGEAIVKVSQELGDMTPKYRDLFVDTFLNGAGSRDAFIRAASLSNLGEVCKHLRYSLGTCMHKIFFCCVSLLKTDPEIPVRQGAALLISQTLSGCDSNSIEILGGDILRDIYRGLKLRSRIEKENSVLKQIELALEELDRIMRDFIFPRDLNKKEIRILH